MRVRGQSCWASRQQYRWKVVPGHIEALRLSQRSSCHCQGDSTCGSVATGHASIGTFSREATGSLASKNTTYTFNGDCMLGEGAPGNLPVTPINTSPSHETGPDSGSVVRTGRHLPTFLPKHFPSAHSPGKQNSSVRTVPSCVPLV